MGRKTVIFGSVAVLLAAGLLLVFWRMKVMGPASARQPGGLAAVSAQGTPIPMEPARATAASTHPNSAFQEAEGLLVSLQLDPYPPTMTSPADFTVTLADTDGRLVGGAQISIDLTMPGMWMPPNMVNLQNTGSGTYTASGHFTMRGLWRMEVIITLDGQTRSVFFDVWL